MNLSNLNVQEMNKSEMTKTEGGLVPAIVILLILAAIHYASRDDM